ncbi:hypothetical protein CP03DC29_0046A, partial [Chlamydia psittaci 03DC29]
MNLRPLAPHA